MNTLTRRLLILSVLLSVLMLSVLSSRTAEAATGSFEQGGGYSPGAYDLNAQQPTDFNWSGHSRFSGVTQNLVKKWNLRVDTNGFRHAPVIGSDGTLYAATTDTSYPKVLAINPDGTVKWTFSLRYAAVSSPVISDNGYIYIPDGNRLQVIDINTGVTKVGSEGFTYKYSIGPIALGSDGTIYTRINATYLTAINPVSGAIKWSANVGYKIGQPSIDKDGNLYVQSLNEKKIALTSIDPNGSIRWSKTYVNTTPDYDFVPSSTPLLDDHGNVYIAGNTTKSLYSITTSDGSLNWATNLSAYLYANPTYDEKEQTLYINGLGGANYLYAVNLDGTIKWKVANTGSMNSPSIDNQGNLFVNTTYSLCVYNKDGALLSSIGVSVISNPIAIGQDGTLYFTSEGSKSVVAIGGEVNKSLVGISLDQSSYTLSVGETHQTVVTAHYSDGSVQDVTGQTVFSSTNPSYASVNATGVVYGAGAGTSTISATWNGQTVNANVSVSAYQEMTVVDDPLLQYSGTWYTSGQPTGYYQETDHYTVTEGSEAQYTFSGTGVAWYGVKGMDHGKADVYIDGVLDATIDLYQTERAQQTLCYLKSGLTYGIHTIKIVHRSDRNEEAAGNFVEVDFLEIY